LQPPSTPPLGASAIEIVEFEHPDWRHYFVTGIPLEIGKLDSGEFSGWRRTGLSFKAWPLGTSGTAAVCRFFSTNFYPRSSHFYTPLSSECAVVKSGGDWSFEGEVFGVVLPSAVGVCSEGLEPLYRVYNNGQGAAPNHRYSTRLSVRAEMITAGWVAEGAGTGVIGCVLP